MNAAEEFEIYRAFKCNPSNMLNDQLNFKSHQLYDMVVDKFILSRNIQQSIVGRCDEIVEG